MDGDQSFLSYITTSGKLNYKKLRRMLHEAFPRSISPRGKMKVPLARSIGKQIKTARPDIPERHVETFVFFYTTSRRYLETMVFGAARVDLRGNHAGDVTAAEEACAKDLLKQKGWLK